MVTQACQTPPTLPRLASFEEWQMWWPLGTAARITHTADWRLATWTSAYGAGGGGMQVVGTAHMCPLCPRKADAAHLLCLRLVGARCTAHAQAPLSRCRGNDNNQSTGRRPWVLFNGSRDAVAVAYMACQEVRARELLVLTASATAGSCETWRCHSHCQGPQLTRCNIACCI